VTSDPREDQKNTVAEQPRPKDLADITRLRKLERDR
jgi:hypothetical protein